MSAFLVDKPHIDTLVTAGLWQRGMEGPLRWTKPGASPDTFGSLTEATTRQTGQMLWSQNARSVAARYGENEPAPLFFYTPNAGLTPNVIAPSALDAVIAGLFKAIACYEYQACETDDWESTEAFRFCHALHTRLATFLRGYDKAPWIITEPSAFAWAIRP